MIHWWSTFKDNIQQSRIIDGILEQKFNIRLRFMVFNATFNHISVISWRSVLLVEEIAVPGEKHRPVRRHKQTLPHNVASSEWDSNAQLKWS